MAQEYKIQAVSQETRNFDTKFGSMTSYKLKLEGVEAAVELAQKSSTAAPSAGQTLHGRIEETQYGPKFKKEQLGFGQGTPAHTVGATSGKPKFDSDPFTMYLSYAKDVAVALIATKEGFAEDKFADILDSVVTGGKTLYGSRPGAEEKPSTDAAPAASEEPSKMKEQVAEFFADAGDEKQIDLSEIPF